MLGGVADAEGAGIQDPKAVAGVGVEAVDVGESGFAVAEFVERPAGVGD